MTETKSVIVITDAAPTPAPLPRSADCPNCSAPAKERTQSNGFGPTYVEICGKCGHRFEERQRHG